MGQNIYKLFLLLFFMRSLLGDPNLLGEPDIHEREPTREPLVGEVPIIDIRGQTLLPFEDPRVDRADNLMFVYGPPIRGSERGYVTKIS